MNRIGGWGFLLLAMAAGIGLYLYEKKLAPGPVGSLANSTIVGGPKFNQPTSGATSVGDGAGISDDTGEDEGIGPQSRTQTEAAYNQDPSVGNGTDLTTGANLAQNDFSLFDDPSEVSD